MKILTNYVSALVKSSLVVFAIVGVVSCKKNNDDNPQPPDPGSQAVGFWQGHYRFTGNLTNYNMKILVKPGGIARVYDMGEKTDTSDVTLKADGTWTFAGDKLEVSMVSDGPILFSGTVDPDAGKWTGSWKKTGVVKGTFSQSK